MRELVWLEHRVCGRGTVGSDAETGCEGSCAKKLRFHPKGMGKALKVRKEECCGVIFILDR